MASGDKTNARRFLANKFVSDAQMARLAPGNLPLVSKVLIVNSTERSDGSVHVGALVGHKTVDPDGAESHSSSVMIWVLEKVNGKWRVTDMHR